MPASNTTLSNGNTIEDQIISRALALGAHMAGIADTATLYQAPSYQLCDRIGLHLGVGSREAEGQQSLPLGFQGAKSIIVIALAHPVGSRELDWWDGTGGTPGNRILMRIAKDLVQWLQQEPGLESRSLPYHLEKGGIFLKDAAVLAGLGCIGKSNLLVTPQYGPRVRLRALAVTTELTPTGPIEFDPCADCHVPCRSACPQDTFAEKIYPADAFQVARLPGRSGRYSRDVCNRRLDSEVAVWEAERANATGESSPVIKYCRRCEFSCPVGRRPKGGA